MSLRGTLIGLVVVVAVLAAAAVALSWERPLAAIDPPPRSNFQQATITRGGELAAIGNCAVCHTEANGAINAGGRALPTPFGTIYSTNITPAVETGIGRWSIDAFSRALRRGVDREGHHLYPAFPYDHFTRMTDADIGALYAYFMTRQPVEKQAPTNALAFPLSYRPVVAAWKLLFLREGPYSPDPGQNAEWNHGAYLAEGLGHCGGCHTPRNAFGAERKDQHFAGGEAEGWVAYAINGSNPAPTPWSADSLAFYLRHGWQAQHGISRGPMAPVTANLATVPEADVRAIAAYVADRMKGRAAPPAAQRPSSPQIAAPASGDSLAHTPTPARGQATGAAIYAGACAGCHESGRAQPFGRLDLHLSTAVRAPDPTNIVNVVLYGIAQAEGARSAVMPGFAGTISDDQLTDLLSYLRASFSSEQPWPDVAGLVARQRRSDQTALYTPHGAGPAPALANQKVTPW